MNAKSLVEALQKLAHDLALPLEELTLKQGDRGIDIFTPKFDESHPIPIAVVQQNQDLHGGGAFDCLVVTHLNDWQKATFSRNYVTRR